MFPYTHKANLAVCREQLLVRGNRMVIGTTALVSHDALRTKTGSRKHTEAPTSSAELQLQPRDRFFPYSFSYKTTIPRQTYTLANDMPGNSITVKPKKRFQCARCHKLFARLEHVQRHDRTRTVPPFISLTILTNRHIDTQERPFLCSQCDSRFTRTYLQRFQPISFPYLLTLTTVTC